MPRKTRHNVLTDEQSIAAINPDNARLISDYAEYLHSTQRSDSTISVYINDLHIAFVWGLRFNKNKCFVDWSKRDIIAFQNWLVTKNGNSPARVRRIKSVLSSLSNYIESICDDEYPNFRNIIHKVESPVSQPVREKTVFKDEELQWLLDQLMKEEEYEKACGLALAMYSGRRKSELTRFKVSYFDDENIIYGSLYKTPEMVKTKGRGEGKYLYCYTLAKQFKPYFDAWMKQRKELGIDSIWLFPRKDHPEDHVNISTFDGWAALFSRKLKMDFYFHSLRHYFTTHLVRMGLPDGVIQDIIGWSSADMLRLYTDIPVDEQLGKYFDENGIKTINPTGLSNL